MKGRTTSIITTTAGMSSSAVTITDAASAGTAELQICSFLQIYSS
jgi:hypothetical protein